MTIAAPQANAPLVSVQQIQEAITSGMSNFRPERVYGGCARIYVEIGSLGGYAETDPEIKKANRRATNALRKQVKKACEGLGRIYQAKGYGVSHAIYIGLDNATCREYSQGAQVARNLKALGIPAWVEGVGD